MLSWSSVSQNSFQKFKLFSLGVWFIVFFGSPVQARTLFDHFRNRVELSDRPQRIVTLAPSLVEIAAQLLGQDLTRIVGVVEKSDFPLGLKQLDSVGAYHQFSVERVVALKPDLVLATADGNPRDRVNQLRELGVPVVISQQKTLLEIEDTVSLVAASLGVAARGREQLVKFRRELDGIAKRSRSHPPLKVLLQLGDGPMVVVGSASFLNDCLKQIGARNIYSDAPLGYPHPSVEDVLARDPDVIVILTFDSSSQRNEEMRREWLSFKNLSAVKRGQVHLFKSDELLRPTFRIVEGLKGLAQLIYGG